MISSIYGFRAPPTYRDAIPGDKFRAAMEMPMSATSTFFDQSKGGVLGSVGVGTVIREALTPGGAPVRPNRFETNESFEARRDEAKPMSKDAYRLSPYFRDEVPWDAAMTEDRAASLASWYDERKIREFYAEKRPIMAFFGNLSGQALDPINYVPVAGPLVKAAAVAKLGKVAGASAAAALDAAGNTAAFSLLTAPVRSKYGDDVSWQATVSQIATAALIGAGFGSIAGALDRSPAAASRSAIEARLATLKTTQEARIALNEGIDAMVRGEDVNLSPNVTGPVARIAAEADGLSRAYDTVRTDPTGPVRDPLVRITPDDIEGTIVARGAFKDINEVEINRRGWGLVKILWRHGEESGRPDELQIKKDDVTALPTVIREFEPSSISNDGAQREWRVERNGRTVVYADSVIDGERHVVTAYVQDPNHADAAKPLSMKRKPAAAGSSSDALNAVGDTTQGLSLRAPDGRPLPATENIARSQPVDNTAARPEPPPEGRKEAEGAIAKPDDYKAMASQYRVDPDSGSFSEEADIAQLGVEGRLTEEDVSVLDSAQSAYEDGAAYGEALKSVASCLI